MRPLHHFTPASGWMNDPNGLIFHEGRWLLFYQHVPVGANGLHWGGASSEDLLHWEDHGPVIFPCSLGEIWSGSVIAYEGKLAAFFTLRQGETADLPERQAQGAAWSTDGGRTWVMDERNPLVESPKRDFRDPKVFYHEESRGWVMVVAAGEELEIWRSSDLSSWERASVLLLPDAAGLIWECPDLFAMEGPSGEKDWILTGSFVNPRRTAERPWAHSSRWLAGKFDGWTFTPSGRKGPLSAGPDDYAAITFADAPGGRRVLLGWLNNWTLGPHISPIPWQGQMTAPREIFWDGERLRQTLAPEWDALPLCTPGEGLPDAFQMELPLGPWRLVLRKGGADVASVEWFDGKARLRRAEGAMPPWKTDSPAFREEFLAVVETEAPVPGGVAVVDRGSLEVFFGRGEAALFAQLFPGEGDWSAALDSSSGSLSL